MPRISTRRISSRSSTLPCSGTARAHGGLVIFTKVQYVSHNHGIGHVSFYNRQRVPADPYYWSRIAKIAKRGAINLGDKTKATLGLLSHALLQLGKTVSI